MTSYLRSWLATGTVAAPPTPGVPHVTPPDDEDEDTETEDDTPPSFPSMNSAQRASSSTPAFLSPSFSMPPPPLPNLAARQPGVAQPSSSSSSSSSSLTVPATTQRAPPPSKKRAKVVLAPGHSPLDWAALKASGADLRGADTLARIPPSVLRQHNKRGDAWSAFGGKVYNITPYLDFHPGGVRELMRVAGRDGTALFAATHAWVNVDFMLDACLIGFLVSEPSGDS